MKPTTAAGRAALDEFLRQGDQQHRVTLNWDDIAISAVIESDAARQQNGYSLLNEEAVELRARRKRIEEVSREFILTERRQSMEANAAFNELEALLGLSPERMDEP